MNYLITFTTYGTWLHGDERGSVVKNHTFIDKDSILHKTENSILKHSPIVLTKNQREIIERTIQEICEYRQWELKAINVRTNHVHAVVFAEESPEKVMNDFKSYSTRRLREAGEFTHEEKIWTKHGSTRSIYGEKPLDAAIHYVYECQ